jgi:hypothetical protein
MLWAITDGLVAVRSGDVVRKPGQNDAMIAVINGWGASLLISLWDSLKSLGVNGVKGLGLLIPTIQFTYVRRIVPKPPDPCRLFRLLDWKLDALRLGTRWSRTYRGQIASGGLYRKPQ